MYVWLALEDCCDGAIEAGDLVVYSDRGFERFRGLPLALGGAIGIAAIDGKLECLHPVSHDVADLKIHELLKLASSLGPYLASRPSSVSAAGEAGPHDRGSLVPLPRLHLLKD